MMTTRLCNLLGIQLPIFSAPMGPDLAGPQLAAAVSGAGGLGLMQSQLSPAEHFREQVCTASIKRYGQALRRECHSLPCHMRKI